MVKQVDAQSSSRCLQGNHEGQVDWAKGKVLCPSGTFYGLKKFVKELLETKDNELVDYVPKKLFQRFRIWGLFMAET